MIDFDRQNIYEITYEDGKKQSFTANSFEDAVQAAEYFALNDAEFEEYVDVKKIECTGWVFVTSRIEDTEESEGVLKLENLTRTSI